MFLPCFLLIQDGFSEEQWKNAEEAIATAKVMSLYLNFDDESTERCRAVETITTGLSSNRFIEDITLRRVPEELHAKVKYKLHSSSVRIDVFSDN